MLTKAQIAFFSVFGYLHIPGYFQQEVGWIIDEFEAAWASRPDVVHDGSKRTIFPVTFVTQTPRLLGLIDHPKVVDVCSGLLGAGYGFQGGDGNCYAGDTGWHSDVALEHWNWKSIARHLKIAFYLDPLTKDTGALRVIPGSHQHGDVYSRLLQTEPPQMDGRDVPAVILESGPGDLVCFDHRIKHAAFGGGARRRMFTTNWMQGPHTPAMREAILADFRTHRDDSKIDWLKETAWIDDQPASRAPMLALLKEFGAFVMHEKECSVP